MISILQENVKISNNWSYNNSRFWRETTLHEQLKWLKLPIFKQQLSIYQKAVSYIPSSVCAPTSETPALLIFLSYKIIFHKCQKLVSALTAEPKLSVGIAAYISATELESANWLASHAAGEWRLKPCVKSSPPEVAQAQALLLPEDWLRNTESAVSCANIKQGDGKWWAMCSVV